LPNDFYSLSEYVDEGNGKIVIVQSVGESSLVQDGEMKKKKFIT